MGCSKSSCFSLLSTTAFILFVLLSVSSLSSSVAEQVTSRVEEMYVVSDLEGALDDGLGVVLFYDSDTGYKNEIYDALSVKYYDAGVHFYAIDVDVCDEDCQRVYSLKMNDLPNVGIFGDGEQYSTMSGSEWSADKIRDYICDIRDDLCNVNPDMCTPINECAISAI